jgi:predicted transcriptional regulator
MTKKIKADQIVEGVKLGLKNTDIADALGVHRNTVSYHLGKLRDKLRDKSPTEYAEFVRQQVEVMATLVEEVHQGKLPPDAANAIRGLMDSVARLTGSNAPAKSMHLSLHRRIDGSTPVQSMTDDELRVVIAREILCGLNDGQIDEVRAFAKSLPHDEPMDTQHMTDEEMLRVIEGSEARIRAEHMRPEPESVGPAEIIIDPTVAEGEKLQ